MISERYALLAFLLLLGISPYAVSPAYIGYLAGFALLLGAMLPRAWDDFDLDRPFSRTYIYAAGALLLVLTNSVVRGNGAWDALRDAGTLFAFLIGRFSLLSFTRGRLLRLLETLSWAGVLVTAATFVGALLAYRDGATAYFWRGSYVPAVHSWLPYFLVVNLTLARLEPSRTRWYAGCALLCVMGSLASLSRTDVLMEAVFGLVLLFRYRARLLGSDGSIMWLLVLVPVLVGIGAAFSQLDVVQERVEVGVNEEDASLGWRVIENLALFDYLGKADVFASIFGSGLGARMPLPNGIVDFDGNDSIPYLHNSLLTIVLKFGVVGLLCYIGYFLQLLKTYWRERAAASGPVSFAGAWILIFNLGKAITLQGLTDWGHVMFLGLGCALIIVPHRMARHTRALAVPAGGRLQ
jgi:hypothetical protein